MDAITVGNDIDCTVTIKQFPFTNGLLTIIENPIGYTVTQDNEIIGKLEMDCPYQIVDGNQKLTIMHFQSNEETIEYYVGNKDEIIISDVIEEADIFKDEHQFGEKNQLHFSLFKKEKQWMVEPKKSTVYLNGRKITAKWKIEIGDWIFTPCLLLRFIDEDVLQVIGYEQFVTNLLSNKTTLFGNEEEVSYLSTYTSDAI